MTILLLSDDLILGGVARHIIDLSAALTEEGHSVTIAATDGSMRHLIPSSVAFIPLFLKDNESMKSRYTGYFSSLSILRHAVHSHSFDLIHSHKRFSHLLGRRLSKKFFIPHITSYHTDFTDRKFLSLFGDRTICCARTISEHIIAGRRAPAGSVSVIYNGVHPVQQMNEERTTEFLGRFGIPRDHVLIGSVGQFVPEKDRPALLRAVNVLRRDGSVPPFTLLLQGFGPQHQKLLSMCEELHLQDIVRFIPGDEPVESVCSLSDFMVLNSLTEGFPLIILEAASAGVPHIASAISGIPEFIEDEVNGLLVTPGDEHQLSLKMARLIADRQLRLSLGETAEKKFREHFTFDQMMADYRSLYRSIIAERIRT